MGTSFLRAETRSVLARNRIDLASLRVGVHENVIRLQGSLRRTAGLPPLTFEAVEGLETELRRIRGVRRIDMHLTNWERRGGTWTPALAPAPVADGPVLEIRTNAPAR